jgi:hypothetical protein
LSKIRSDKKVTPVLLGQFNGFSQAAYFTVAQLQRRKSHTFQLVLIAFL